MPPPIAAEIVVTSELTAIVRAMPVRSVTAMAGSSDPAPMVNTTATSGTPWPSALNTVACTSSRRSTRDPAVSTIRVGTADAPGTVGATGSGGGSYAPHAGIASVSVSISARRLQDARTGSIRRRSRAEVLTIVVRRHANRDRFSRRAQLFAGRAVDHVGDGGRIAETKHDLFLRLDARVLASRHQPVKHAFVVGRRRQPAVLRRMHLDREGRC